jgi:hypothetical protein
LSRKRSPALRIGLLFVIKKRPQTAIRCCSSWGRARRHSCGPAGVVEEAESEADHQVIVPDRRVLSGNQSRYPVVEGILD